MSVEKLFPTAIIVLMVGAALVYAWKGDATRCAYMLAAAALNAVITYPLPRFPWTH